MEIYIMLVLAIIAALANGFAIDCTRNREGEETPFLVSTWIVALAVDVALTFSIALVAAH